MKKILFLLLFIPLVSFGQDDINLNIDKKVEVTKKRDKTRGLIYKGSGIYTYSMNGEIVHTGTKSKNDKKNEEKAKVASQKLKTKITKEVNEFSKQNNYDYKIILIDNVGTSTFPKLVMHFKVTNKDGSEVIFKSEAKKQLLELKEYLDLGIITQEEFDRKADYLKKILLGN